MSRHRHQRMKEMSQRRFLFLCGMAVLLLALACGVMYVGGRWLESGDVEEPRGDLGTRFETETLSYNGQSYIPRRDMTTMLVLGVDLTESSQTGGYLEGGQADFLMLLVLDHDNDVVHQLQIDRDTLAEITVLGMFDNAVGTTKLQLCLSHTYSRNRRQGAELTLQALERLLGGVKVDMYMSFDIDSIGELNDALGGVTVTVQDDFSAHDPQMVPGATLRLTGEQAEIFTRSRMDVGDGTNAARMVRQRVFLSGVIQILKTGMAKDANYIGKLFDQLEDRMITNVRRGRLINEANKAYHYDILPVETPQGEYIVGSNGKRAFQIDEAALNDWVLRIFYEPANLNNTR